MLVEAALVYGLDGLNAVDTQLVRADTYYRPMLPVGGIQSAVLPLLEPRP